MKKVLVFIFLIIPFLALSQEGQKTKFDEFSSRTGVIIKFRDFKSGSIVNYGFKVASTRIRRLQTSGTNEVFYFFQIEKTVESKSVASIEYHDLLEIIKSIEVLKTELENDIKEKPQYIENKFRTKDDFEIGYYIDGEKTEWFLSWKNSILKEILAIRDFKTVEGLFLNAKYIIEEMKKNEAIN